MSGDFSGFEDSPNEVDLSFGDVQQFSILPVGPTILRIIKAELRKITKKGENEGKPMLWLEMTSTEHGGKVWDQFPIIKKSMWKLQQVLEAFTGRDWKSDNMKLRPHELVGLTAGATVIVTSYNGKKKNEVQEYMRPDMLPEASDSNFDWGGVPEEFVSAVNSENSESSKPATSPTEDETFTF